MSAQQIADLKELGMQMHLREKKKNKAYGGAGNAKDKFKPILPKNFEPSKVEFSYAKSMSSGAKLFFLEYEGAVLYIQSPEMSLAFDPQVYGDGDDPANSNDAKYNMKANLNLSQDSCKIFHDKMIQFDERLKELAKENSVEWFKKKNLSNDVIDSMFSPSIKIAIDAETGEPNGRWPPQFGFKVKKKNGNIMCRCFNGSLPKIEQADGKLAHPEINLNDKDEVNHMPIEKCLKKNKCEAKGLGSNEPCVHACHWACR